MLLIQFWTIFSFYTSWKHQTTKVFLVFSECIKWKHWSEMGWSLFQKKIVFKYRKGLHNCFWYIPKSRVEELCTLFFHYIWSLNTGHRVEVEYVSLLFLLVISFTVKKNSLMEDDAKVFSKKEKKTKHYEPVEEMESMKNSKKKKKKLNEPEEPPTIYSKTKKMRDVDSDGNIKHILVYFSFYYSIVLNIGREIQSLILKHVNSWMKTIFGFFVTFLFDLSEKFLNLPSRHSKKSGFVKHLKNFFEFLRINSVVLAVHKNVAYT